LHLETVTENSNDITNFSNKLKNNEQFKNSLFSKNNDKNQWTSGDSNPVSSGDITRFIFPFFYRPWVSRSDSVLCFELNSYMKISYSKIGEY